MSTASVSGGNDSAAWIAVAFVLSAYAGFAVAKNSCSTTRRSGRSARARRAASTPIDVVSSS
jgi:hypothetical protein